MQIQVLTNLFSQEQEKALKQLLPTLTEAQKIWLSGYFAGAVAVNSQAQPVAAAPIQGGAASKEITILYGSQTGNAKGLALKAGKTLEEQGFKVTVSSMNDFKANQLKNIQYLLICVSTHGEGDPPDPAMSFYEFLFSKRAPRLEQLQYSVLALGDSSYQHFCKTGKDFDARLEELGAVRIHPRVDCDVDYQEAAAEWLEGVVGKLREKLNQPAAVSLQAVSAVQTGSESIYSRFNPFKAEVLENLNLNGRGSGKETRHLELSIEGSGFSFKPGDCVGIYPENDPELVDRLLEELKWDKEDPVAINKKGDHVPLREALLKTYEITVLTKQLLEKAGELSANKQLKEMIAPGNEEKLASYIAGRDLLDLVRDYGPWGADAQEFVSALRKIPARLYSIASSSSAYPDEVHLTIGVVRYEAHGRPRKGVCSTYCAERIQPGDTLSVFVQHNENFKLPDNPETPIIMIGPGTGVAPFRAFMQEREEQGATGKSWLFFGDRHFKTDFLYQVEWQKWLQNGVLTRMSVAFSRDADRKIYVQHRMLEHSRELYNWLEEGATVYICGDEKNMARDVHNTLIGIIEKEGGLSREKAEEYLAKMQQERRYQRDVY